MLNPLESVARLESLNKKRGRKPHFDREAKLQHAEIMRQFAKYRTDNGKLNVKSFLEDNMELILLDLISPGKGIPSKKTEMMLKIADIYTEKQEVTQKIEFTVADRQAAAADIIGGLKREAEVSGVCPICGISQTLRISSCVDTRPE